LVVPFPPGGLIDNMARLVAPKLAQELGQPIVIDNKPGAGGNLGAAEAARSPADGYTLLMASPPLTISPALYSKLPYKPEQIAPVALLGRVPNVLVVNPAAGINSLAELTALAQSKPGQLNYASNGQGTSLHLSAELYKSQSGAFVTHIPYRGAAAGLTGLIVAQLALLIYQYFDGHSDGHSSGQNSFVDTTWKWLAVFGTVLFTAFIAYDTQRLKRNAAYSTTPNYPRDSLSLFLDIANLFNDLSILQR
jgi:tripartite-type tricarboxylate transporter receptor subunit TctC